MALRPNLHPLLGFAPPMHPLFRQGVQGDNDCMKCNVTGKKIIPFCTSGMSGVEKSVEHIKGIVGESVTVCDGKRLGAEGSEEEVKLWTELLGL